LTRGGQIAALLIGNRRLPHEPNMAQPNRKLDKIDSSRQHLAMVYAKALLGAAESAGQADAVVDELDSLIDDVLNKLPQFDTILKSPRVTHEERLPLLEKSLGGRLSPTLHTFLKVLSRHGRFDCLRAIARAARDQLNTSRGRVEVIVETAHPISNPIRERIVVQLNRLLGREVMLTTQVNADLLGGMVVRVGDTVYDASVVARLKRMQEVTLDQTKQRIRESIERFALPT
jgi:F-type H+-transporting ATPase subunit delta